jgi:hypothetical protein
MIPAAAAAAAASSQQPAAASIHTYPENFGVLVSESGRWGAGRPAEMVIDASRLLSRLMIRLICRGRVARRKFPTRCTAAAAAAAAAVSLVKYKGPNDA